MEINNYKPFSLVNKATLAEHSGMIESTLYTWSKTKPKTVRILEYGVYFDLLDVDTMTQLKDPKLSFLEAIKIVGAGKLKVTDVPILVDVKRRTLNSWWKGEANKRLICITLLKGMITMLAIAKNPKLAKNWPVTYQESLLSGCLAEINIDNILKKAFDIWVESQ